MSDVSTFFFLIHAKSTSALNIGSLHLNNVNGVRNKNANYYLFQVSRIRSELGARISPQSKKLSRRFIVV